MEKENVLNLLKECFDLAETIDELSDKVNISFEKGHYCDEYIKVEIKDNELHFNEEQKYAIMKYAGCDGYHKYKYQKYKREEGYKNGKKTLESMKVKTFLIHDISKRTKMLNELKFSPIYKRRWDMFNFDYVNEFFIAYD
jgi:hypothetical protein